MPQRSCHELWAISIRSSQSCSFPFSMGQQELGSVCSLYRRPYRRNSALHCEMLKITKTSQHTATSYLATTMEQDAALCHGFVKKFLPDQMFLLGNPAGAFFKWNRLVTMCTCSCETTWAERKCLSWTTCFPSKIPVDWRPGDSGHSFLTIHCFRWQDRWHFMPASLWRGFLHHQRQVTGLMSVAIFNCSLWKYSLVMDPSQPLTVLNSQSKGVSTIISLIMCWIIRLIGRGPVRAGVTRLYPICIGQVVSCLPTTLCDLMVTV